MSNYNRTPDFRQMLKVLERQAPDRDVLFELFMNNDVYEWAVGGKLRGGRLNQMRGMARAFAVLGYDYATCWGSGFGFPNNPKGRGAQTYSLNDAPMITGRASFDAYPWPRAGDFDYSSLKDIEPDLPGGMKLMVMGPGGVLENAIKLVGYDNLCYMLYDDEPLLAGIFERIGSGLAEHYRLAAPYSSVGMLMSNDDWGFKSQTMLSLSAMRKYVFPWHKEIVRIAHAAGKPALLHSCGNFSQIAEDLYDMGFDARHSYEDNILPVEDAYELFMGGKQMAVLGGIDLDFLLRAPDWAVRDRARGMLARARERGGYALGSGNSIPRFCPLEKYLAMISVADEM